MSADHVGASVRGGDVELPALVCSSTALENNLTVMAEYARAHGFRLAPHGKTTMSPELFRRQLEAGAWGITVANVSQASVAFGAGASRVLVANEVVSRAEVRHAADLVRSGGRELLCLVDSLRSVEILESGLRARPERLSVLVELGVPGHRTGAASVGDAVEVAEAAAAAPHLELAGAEGYEGVLGSDRSPAVLAAVDSYLGGIGELARALVERGLVEREVPVVSAGGSKYLDRVAAVLAPGTALAGRETLLVVRSGCYLTHDHGVYDGVSPLAHAGDRRLVAALRVWANVLAVPDPGRAIVGLGKRDAPYDAGLPVPLSRVPESGREEEPLVGARVVALDDQHAYVEAPADVHVEVGDRLSFGISHPCTAFDKWRTVLLVDDDEQVTGAVSTMFH
ncbi:MAG: alanine racemase [Actinomycetota bacterium]|nr:alanine racemase [Actinomycetota bacterium]